MHINYYPTSLHITAGITRRFSGVSLPPFDSLNMAFYVGDNKEHVLTNRQLVADELNIPLSQWVFPKLTHSDHIHQVTRLDGGKGAFSEEGSLFDVDSIYTYENDLVLSVFSADCIPILYYHELNHVIGAIHCGWTGTVKEIVRKTFEHLIENESCNPSAFTIFIGPSIRTEAFEVKEDVIARVKTMTLDSTPFIREENDRYFLDLVGMNVQMLMDLNISYEQIMISPECTFTQSQDYFSYRASPTTGRHASFIVQRRKEYE